ncbi:hypothetical protein [Sporisorium scitamineum]|uniref:Uncharacterized protein n=1 Tax=Sporisorium scitamineum TaxID=49012 RepID=A0A0F7S318_9BASI|nr:hypothetical protein [Sporisorium scitamineum]
MYNAGYGGYSGYPRPNASSAAGLGNAYGEQSGVLNFGRPFTTNSCSANSCVIITSFNNTL